MTHRIENIMGKGIISRLEQYLLFTQWLGKSSAIDVIVLKVWSVIRERVYLFTSLSFATQIAKSSIIIMTFIILWNDLADLILT